MTPKQKAAELILRYMAIVIKQDTAKKCALAAVDEMKQSLYNNNLMNMYDYWFEVKKEIENL